MRDVLIGTTNHAKIEYFQEILSGYDVNFLKLYDLGITCEPEEQGLTPKDNALLKAGFYGQYFDSVICHDSGLYFRELALDDRWQPGLNIRTPGRKARLNDEEMIAYYAELIYSLGGKVSAYYLNGFAVYNKGMIHSYMEDIEMKKRDAFYMVDTPSPKRQAGSPLDSLSLNRDGRTYFVDAQDTDCGGQDGGVSRECEERIVEFFTASLGLE